MVTGVLDGESQKQSRIDFADDLLSGTCNDASVGFVELGLEFLVQFLTLASRFHAQLRHGIGLDVTEDQIVQFLDSLTHVPQGKNRR